jgi:prepilin-type N-terminal cleavage/methylation domain-containing protein
VLDRIRPSDEEGFTIVELMAALSVLAIGFFSLAGALGLSFKQISLGRQRQTATEVANAQIEHLRSIPYEQVAVTWDSSDPDSPPPQHTEDEDNPDHFVSEDGSRFDTNGDGDYDEDLILDEANGQVLHVDDPYAVGSIQMAIYQYVTWADISNSVKRLTVVVVYKPTPIEGAAKMVRVSSLFTPGTVTVDGSSAGSSVGGGSTSSPAPTPTATGSCNGDTTGPSGSFAIVSSTGQTGYTASTTIALSLSLSDGCGPIRARFSNDGTTYGAETTYDSASATVTWTLPSGDGTKTVYAKARDGMSNETTLSPKSVILDTQAPGTPGQLSDTISCSGVDRSVTLNWGTASGSPLGYRVYESDNSGAWAVQTTSSLLTFTTTHKKALDSVRFYVAAYDAAGNESDATNIISIAKNQCS